MSLLERARKGQIKQDEFYELFGEKWGSGGIEYEITFINPHLAWMKYCVDPVGFMNAYGKYARRN